MPDPVPIRNVLTNDGKTLLSRLTSDNVWIVFTKATIGKGDASDKTVSQIEEFHSIMTPLSITGAISKRRQQGNAMTLSVQFTNQGLTETTYVHEIGVYAKLNTEADSAAVMYSYMSFGSYPDLLLDEGTATVQRVYDVPYVFNGDSPTVQVTISASALITNDDTVTSAVPASSSNVGKVVRLNSSGKLDVDITGDANTLDGHDSTYFATSDHDHDDATTSVHGFMSVADKTRHNTMSGWLNQSLKTTDSPEFAGLTVNGVIRNARFE